LGRTDDARRAAYRALFKARLDPNLLASIRHATNGNFVLGNKRFETEIARMLRRRVTPGRARATEAGNAPGNEHCGSALKIYRGLSPIGRFGRRKNCS
jgi:putative transposase